MNISAEFVTVVGTAVLTVLAHIPVLAVFAKRANKVVQQDAPEIAQVGNAVVKGAEELFKLPEFATLKEKLAAKEKELLDSEVVKIAGVALHGYEKALSALTPNEQATLVTYVRTALSKVGLNVSDQQIVGALHDAQQLADAFKQTDAFKNTVALEQSLKALAGLQQPVQSAQPAS